MLKKFLYGLLALVLVLVAGTTAFYFIYLKPTPKPISNEDRTAITVMPLPASLKLTGSSFLLNDDFGISIQGPSDSLVLYASLRFKDRLAQLSGRFYTENGNGLIIRFDSATHAIQPVVTDESYRLTITAKGMELRANSGYGVLRGLETLVQLMAKNENKITWPAAVIRDEPRYPWRGLMIDACRHWIPKEVILRNIDAMAAVKMNVLHWHLSEYQAFRVESKVFPKLHELGSDGNYYTQEDIREVVAYAHLRGIRVIPEFDMPGHTSSFLVGYPELASAPGPYQLEKGFGVFTPVMDPTREEVYAFIDRFIGEMVTLFPDPYFHIGGDEVIFTDWDNNAAIQAFMKTNNIANNHDLQAYFNQRLEKILVKYNKKMVGWDEILNPNLGQEIVVQSWRSHKSLFDAVHQGRKAILSAGYYLDHKLPAARHYAVDPEVMPGAVAIQPDSLHWQQYAITLRISNSNVNTSLILYGESDNLRGLFYMMDNATSFEKATLTDGQLKFSFASEFGTIDLTSSLSGDSISGKMSLGLLSFPFSGIKTGGHDVVGTRPPNVEQVRPLRDDERMRILGGEAAMWTEVVTAENIDSRIWPRTAAMAEKWWSPATLTQNARDMYRRLEVFSERLEMLGLEHHKGPERIMQDLAQGRDVQVVKTLIDVLEEVKYYERLTMEITTLTPMNEVVDAAQPESLTAMKFTFCVDDYLADPLQGSCAAEIRSWLTRWRDNHERFVRVAEGNSRLNKVVPISEALYVLADASLLAMDIREGKVQLTESEGKKLSQAKELQVSPQASVLLAVVEPLKKLLTSAF